MKTYINEDGIEVDPVGSIVKKAERDAAEVIRGRHVGKLLCERRKGSLATMEEDVGKELYDIYLETVDSIVCKARRKPAGTYRSSLPTWEEEPERLIIR